MLVETQLLVVFLVPSKVLLLPWLYQGMATGKDKGTMAYQQRGGRNVFLTPPHTQEEEYFFIHV